MRCPLVSAVIPVYNGERFLAAAIESVLQQDYQPLELIVVDDGSTDSTAEIIQRYSAVTYVHQPNQGHATAKNTGLSAARGEIIAFLDADDLWQRNKTRVQVDALLRQPETSYVLCHMRHFLEGGQSWPDWVRLEHRDTDQPCPLPSALMAWRSAFERIGAFDPAYWHGNDSDWISRSRDAGLKWLMLSDSLVLRRIHGSNLSGDQAGLSRDLIRLLAASLRRKRAAEIESATHAA